MTAARFFGSKDFCAFPLVIGSILKRLFRRRATAEPDARACLEALHSGELQVAIDCFQDHLSRHPDDAVAYNNLGVALQRRGRGGEALACYETAMRLAPDNADGWYNAAIIYHLSRRIEQAEAHYRHALQLDPALAEAHRDYSMLRLSRGNFSPEVWSSFRHRRQCAGFEATVTRCPARLWNGEPVEGRTVLVYGEQGLGDEILFASCYGDLIARARHCVIETEPRLESLFRRSFPGATVLGRQREAELAERYAAVDFQAPCGDLPVHFRASREAFERGPCGYLRAGAEAVTRWRQALTGLGPGLKVGISWRGGTPRTNLQGRSIAVDEWLPVFRTAGTHFISLQYGHCLDDLARAGALGVSLHHWPEALADYDETAALVAALDLVVTVTTSVAHLAGALGARVWILANAAPRWCYLASGPTTPWYPSARILRQSAAGDWSGVLAEVAGGLAREAR